MGLPGLLDQPCQTLFSHLNTSLRWPDAVVCPKGSHKEVWSVDFLLCCPNPIQWPATQTQTVTQPWLFQAQLEDLPIWNFVWHCIDYLLTCKFLWCLCLHFITNVMSSFFFFSYYSVKRLWALERALYKLLLLLLSLLLRYTLDNKTFPTGFVTWNWIELQNYKPIM